MYVECFDLFLFMFFRVFLLIMVFVYVFGCFFGVEKFFRGVGVELDLVYGCGVLFVVEDEDGGFDG